MKENDMEYDRVDADVLENLISSAAPKLMTSGALKSMAAELLEHRAKENSLTVRFTEGEILASTAMADHAMSPTLPVHSPRELALAKLVLELSNENRHLKRLAHNLEHEHKHIKHELQQVETRLDGLKSLADTAEEKE